jgi:hypothetical protein
MYMFVSMYVCMYVCKGTKSMLLSASAFRVPRLLLMGLGVDYLKLIKVVYGSVACTCMYVCMCV